MREHAQVVLWTVVGVILYLGIVCAVALHIVNVRKAEGMRYSRGMYLPSHELGYFVSVERGVWAVLSFAIWFRLLKCALSGCLWTDRTLRSPLTYSSLYSLRCRQPLTRMRRQNASALAFCYCEPAAHCHALCTLPQQARTLAWHHNCAHRQRTRSSYSSQALP